MEYQIVNDVNPTQQAVDDCPADSLIRGPRQHDGQYGPEPAAIPRFFLSDIMATLCCNFFRFADLPSTEPSKTRTYGLKMTW